MNTSLVEPKRLSANQRLLRSLEDTSQRDAMPAVFDAVEPLEGTWLLRKIGASVPKSGVERDNYVTAARIAVVVALLSDDMQARPLDDETRDVLFRRAGEVFKTVYGSAHATSQTRLTSGHTRSRTTAPPVETMLTDMEAAALLLVREALPRVMRETLWRLIHHPKMPVEDEAEKKARQRVRKRISEIMESGNMSNLVTMLQHRLAEADRNSRRLDLIEQALGLDVAAQAEGFLVTALEDVEDEVRHLIEQRD